MKKNKQKNKTVVEKNMSRAELLAKLKEKKQ